MIPSTCKTDNQSSRFNFLYSSQQSESLFQIPNCHYITYPIPSNARHLTITEKVNCWILFRMLQIKYLIRFHLQNQRSFISQRIDVTNSNSSKDIRKIEEYFNYSSLFSFCKTDNQSSRFNFFLNSLLIATKWILVPNSPYILFPPIKETSHNNRNKWQPLILEFHSGCSE